MSWKYTQTNNSGQRQNAQQQVKSNQSETTEQMMKCFENAAAHQHQGQTQVSLDKSSTRQVMEAEYGHRITQPFNAILRTQKMVYMRDINKGVFTENDHSAITAQWVVLRFQISEYRAAVKRGQLDYECYVNLKKQLEDQIHTAPYNTYKPQGSAVDDWVDFLWKDQIAGIHALILGDDIDRHLKYETEVYFHNRLMEFVAKPKEIPHGWKQSKIF